jgi:hypothetical protein
VYIFIVDAGCIIASAFCVNSVSPRVSETMIAPHSPLRVWLDSALPTASASALAPRGALHVGAEDAAGCRDAVAVIGVVRLFFVERDCAPAEEAKQAPASATRQA